MVAGLCRCRIPTRARGSVGRKSKESPWGRPISHPVNRGRTNFCGSSRIPSLLCPAGDGPAHLVLVVGRDSAHQSPMDQGRHGVLCSPYCTGSPRKPSVPHRVQSWRANVLAQICGFATFFPRRSNPLVARDTGAASPCSGGAGGGVQSGLLVMPTPWRHCHHRPIAPYRTLAPRRKGSPLFMTCSSPAPACGPPP